MALDADFLLRVKESVTEKLKNLGAFIDEELPDYIMVMVANKKSESSMAKDLQLFLGDHTVAFTKWLHATLRNLEDHDGVQCESKEKLTKSKPMKRKTSRSSEQESNNQKLDVRSNTRSSSRSRSPLTVRTKYVREPHFDESPFASAEEYVNDEITSSDLIPETRQRPKVNRSCLGSIQPVGRLLQQAVKEARANVRPSDTSDSTTSPTRSTVNRPVACSDVSSSGTPVGNTKFYVTLSGADCKQPTFASAADSSVGPCWAAEDDTVSASRVVRGVKARLGTRRILPYLVRPKLSAKERLGPVKTSNQRAAESPEDIRFSSDAFEDQEDFVEIVEELDDLDLMPEGSDMGLSSVSKTNDPSRTRPGNVRLVDRLNQKQLVVTLNDVNEDDDVPLAATTDLVVDRRLSDDVTNAVNDDGPVNIPSSLERCRYWPNCRNGTKCAFIHPSGPCPTFPRCRSGSKCTYIHPECRYGASCTRSDCAFAHSSRPAMPQPVAPPVSASQVVCRFQGRCTNTHCPFYHPPAPRFVPVLPFNAAPRTLTASPIPCRYGTTCPNRSSCPFKHFELPKPDRLKWVAPSKRPAAETTDTAPHVLKSANVASASCNAQQ